MLERFEKVLSAQDVAVIKESGYAEGGAFSWDSRGMGETPMVLVIDMQRFIVGDDEPILDAVEKNQLAVGEDAWDTIEEIEPFLATAREAGIPVTYTRILPRTAPDLTEDDLSIVAPLAPEPEDLVIDKSYTSAFYGTDLVSQLVDRKVDTVVVVGNVTSGCVRATVVDAVQYGFDVVVPHECVFDRLELSHEVALMEMWMKYASVLDRADAEAYLKRVGTDVAP